MAGARTGRCHLGIEVPVVGVILDPLNPGQFGGQSRFGILRQMRDHAGIIAAEIVMKPHKD